MASERKTHYKTEQMKRVLIIISFFFPTIAVIAQINEEELIRENYDTYRTYLHDRNGKEAVKYVDSNTIKYYGDILELVKSADSLKVESLPIFDKIMVLTIRGKIPKEDILKFNGTTLFTYAVDNGMIDKASAKNLAVGDITIEKYFAKGQIVANGIESPYFIQFNKEDELWKYDLTSSFTIGITALHKLVEELGEKGFIRIMLSANPKNNQYRNVWKPIK